jgi:hypothetical protein
MPVSPAHKARRSLGQDIENPDHHRYRAVGQETDVLLSCTFLDAPIRLCNVIRPCVLIICFPFFVVVFFVFLLCRCS